MKLVIALLVAAGCGSSADKSGSSAGKSDDTSKIDLAKLTVKKYAYEAAPQWAMTHTSKECPDRLGDLDEYINAPDSKDPWGHPYVMLCGANLPPGAKGFAVLSLGPDGKQGTADDIKSW